MQLSSSDCAATRKCPFLLCRNPFHLMTAWLIKIWDDIDGEFASMAARWLTYAKERMGWKLWRFRLFTGIECCLRLGPWAWLAYNDIICKALPSPWFYMVVANIVKQILETMRSNVLFTFVICCILLHIVVVLLCLLTADQILTCHESNKENWYRTL